MHCRWEQVIAILFLHFYFCDFVFASYFCNSVFASHFAWVAAESFGNKLHISVLFPDNFSVPNYMISMSHYLDKLLERTKIVPVTEPVFAAFLWRRHFWWHFFARWIGGKKRDQTFKQLGVRQKDTLVMTEGCQESRSSYFLVKFSFPFS